jgi:eukaryotic-like serine/threonine-protein kinase
MERMPRSREVIDERFTIEQLAGFGGMGQIYRARDRRSGGLVALKVMHDAERLELERFAREAQVLSTLSHPGIVRYIDSGITAEGEPYLVMEWLSGETLSSRLQRTQLTLPEALALGRRVASALSAIHRGGVVHRDIKPSNLFLRDGAIDKVTLIDFGMARRPLADTKLTVTGTMLGTPGYIAPEQVYNMQNLDGRADIFSLGCVVYRCISGRAPFRGPDALRLMVNGLPEQLPRLREFHPSIPRELDDLVARMLSRSPEDRPASGEVVATELQAIEESAPSPHPHRPGSGSNVLSEIMAAERRLMCAVLARIPERAEGPPTVAERAAHERALSDVIERHRGKLEILANGYLLVILSNADAAIDLTTRAARCALALHPLLGDGALAIVTGREIPGPSLRDSELLRRAMVVLEAPHAATVHVDDLTAALLHGRFDTGKTGRDLRGERREPAGVQLATGEPAVCVGREQELDQLEMIFHQCADEHVATMVLLSGPEGVGKSRLGQELLRRLTAHGQPPQIWLGEADPLSSGSVFGLLVQVLRRALGLVDGEPVEARRDKILAWVARHPGVGDAAFAAALGDLVGTPFETKDDDEPGAARDSARLPSEQIRQTFFSFLREECATQPVVIVLEDLHWGDLSTIKLMYAALGALADQPLLVLALARNNVTELFPQLWADRCVQEIRLRRLSRRASMQLVRQGVGDAVTDEAAKALVEHSDRHAAYLEELIRAAAAGQRDRTPQTVLAMVQARLEKLDPAARRVLRAASVFGDVFWRGGVEALLGVGDTAAWLAVLADQAVIEHKDEARFPGETEYRFPHALLREAAYEMLPADDLVAGHWLAGQWLESVGEDSKVVEAHFERCGRGGAPPTHL